MQQAHSVNTQSIMHSRLTPITHKHMTQQSTFAQISTITGSHKHGTESGIEEGDDSLKRSSKGQGGRCVYCACCVGCALWVCGVGVLLCAAVPLCAVMLLCHCSTKKHKPAHSGKAKHSSTQKHTTAHSHGTEQGEDSDGSQKKRIEEGVRCVCGECALWGVLCCVCVLCYWQEWRKHEPRFLQVNQ